ncbi:GntR family transcriptional regulator [Micromonospora humida]|uniref:GntR family transcriptional regulator n=1 Tax=Micromonospora humida TaxID=2809018 RepID=UPI003F4E2622
MPAVGAQACSLARRQRDLLAPVTKTKSATTSEAAYVRVAWDFRKQVDSGQLKPGEKLPSFAALRKQCNVGTTPHRQAHGYHTKRQPAENIPANSACEAIPMQSSPGVT